MQTAWIIAVGTELTLGQSVDTNSAWLAQQLAAIGLRAERHVAVADDEDALVDVIRDAARRADAVIMTGGLGPTDDDPTRAALARAANDTLVEHADCLEDMRQFFAARKREMAERNRCQAMIPSRAEPLHNDRGTAPGIALQIDGTPCYAMPGVPYEMKAMFAQHVLPALRSQSTAGAIVQRTLHSIGVSESEVGERLTDLMQRGRNPEVGTAAAVGEIAVRVNASAPTSAEAERLADETVAEVRRRLGDAIYGAGDETLAAAVGVLLRDAGKTMATAESCTGGLISQQITDVPGSSEYFLGGVVAYANAVKEQVLGVASELLAAHGAVSAPVAAAMAQGVQRTLQADYAVAMTGVAGPGGGTVEKPVGLVFIAWANADGVRVEEHRIGETAGRTVIRERTARLALDGLRRELLSAKHDKGR